jgi:Transglutaminase-like superfamily
MERLHKFRRLPLRYKHLLVKSIVLLGLVRVGLWLLRFQTLRRLLAYTTRGHAEAKGGDQASINQVARAVTVASRYVPAATCLTQALAAQILLSRRGHPASLRIGVGRSEAGEFQAHAWVECQGKIVIGGAQALSRYTPFPPLDGEGS